MALSPKQELFCQEYIIDLNATQAAIRAGYSANTARSQGQRLSTNVDIQSRIQALMKERGERVSIDADYVLKRLVEVDQMDVMDILDDKGALKPIKEWPKVWRQFISGFDIAEVKESNLEAIVKKIKWPDKVRNLELIGKHVSVGAFRERVALGGDGEPIKVEATLTPSEAYQAMLKAGGAA